MGEIDPQFPRTWPGVVVRREESDGLANGYECLPKPIG